MVTTIEVHVLHFLGCRNSHVEIVLVEKTLMHGYYYNINRWSPPERKALVDQRDCLKALRTASQDVFFTIEADMDDLIAQWRNYYFRQTPSLLTNNCADAVAWFLSTFAGITNPGSCEKPITCDYLYCGLFAPSFLQYCTTPGRIIEHTKRQLKEKNTSNLTITEEPKASVPFSNPERCAAFESTV